MPAARPQQLLVRSLMRSHTGNNLCNRRCMPWPYQETDKQRDGAAYECRGPKWLHKSDEDEHWGERLVSRHGRTALIGREPTKVEVSNLSGFQVNPHPTTDCGCDIHQGIQ
jgi:hypothetical protein